MPMPAISKPVFSSQRVSLIRLFHTCTVKLAPETAASTNEPRAPIKGPPIVTGMLIFETAFLLLLSNRVLIKILNK